MACHAHRADKRPIILSKHDEQCVEGCYSGLFMSKLFANYWGMLFQVLRLGYLHLGRVCLGFVSGTIERI